MNDVVLEHLKLRFQFVLHGHRRRRYLNRLLLQLLYGRVERADRGLIIYRRLHLHRLSFKSLNSLRVHLDLFFGTFEVNVEIFELVRPCFFTHLRLQLLKHAR